MWDEMKISYNLNNKSYFKWRRGKKYSKRAKVVPLMNSKEIYSVIISSKVNLPTSQIYCEKKVFFLQFSMERHLHIFPQSHHKCLLKIIPV